MVNRSCCKLWKKTIYDGLRYFIRADLRGQSLQQKPQLGVASSVLKSALSVVLFLWLTSFSFFSFFFPVVGEVILVLLWCPLPVAGQCLTPGNKYHNYCRPKEREISGHFVFFLLILMFSLFFSFLFVYLNHFFKKSLPGSYSRFPSTCRLIVVCFNIFRKSLCRWKCPCSRFALTMCCDILKLRLSCFPRRGAYFVSFLCAPRSSQWKIPWRRVLPLPRAASRCTKAHTQYLTHTAQLLYVPLLVPVLTVLTQTM